MVVLTLHMLRVFFTGAFHGPRQFDWVIGLALFALLLTEKKAFQDAAIFMGDAAAGLPQRSRIQYNLSLLLKQLNRNAEAETALNRALSLDPKNPDDLYAVAVLYLEWNRLDDALEVAVRLREAHPELAMGRDLVNYINSSMTMKKSTIKDDPGKKEPLMKPVKWSH